jgi:hypothetical protein
LSTFSSVFSEESYICMPCKKYFFFSFPSTTF